MKPFRYHHLTLANGDTVVLDTKYALRPYGDPQPHPDALVARFPAAMGSWGQSKATRLADDLNRYEDALNALERGPNR